MHDIHVFGNLHVQLQNFPGDMLPEPPSLALRASLYITCYALLAVCGKLYWEPCLLTPGPNNIPTKIITTTHPYVIHRVRFKLYTCKIKNIFMPVLSKYSLQEEYKIINI